MTKLPPERQELFGLELDALTLDEVIERCEQRLETRTRSQIGVLNAAKFVNMRSDQRLHDSLLECDLLLADGQSVVWASRILGKPLPQRVAGIDLFESLMDLADRRSLGVYLLGAEQEVLDALLDIVRHRWAGARVAGSYHGYFPEEDSERIADEISASQADMLFIGITSPKKEIFLGTYGDRLGVPILHGVGGSFDVLAGVTRRAPVVLQRLGLEWGYRLWQEPRRLWRRYARTNTAFVGLVLAEKLRQSQVRRSAPNVR